jgi:sigma-B regulation protein RsbQ
MGGRVDERLIKRHNIKVNGNGSVTLLFVHGLGTGHDVWRHVAPAFSDRYRVVTMDLLGCGDAARHADDPARYDMLDGHAQDVVQVAAMFHPGRTVLVMHSVGAMIGLRADLMAPQMFDAHIMVAPSPCYMNLPGYLGGFEPAQIQGFLAAIDEDLPAWARTMAPAMMGESPPGPLSAQLGDMLCQADPALLRQFARATFLCDMRDQLPYLVKPVAVLQCTHDMVAPVAVGRYMCTTLPDCNLSLIDCAGHFPQLRAPAACLKAMGDFIDSLGLTGGAHVETALPARASLSF